MFILTGSIKPAVATSNPVREDLVAVPTSTSTKTASPDTVPLEWADEILSLDSDDEEAEELDHRLQTTELWKLSLDLNLLL